MDVVFEGLRVVIELQGGAMHTKTASTASL